MALAVQGMYLSSTSPPQETGASVVPSFVPGLSLDNDVSVAANLTMNWIANDLTRRQLERYTSPAFNVVHVSCFTYAKN